jgi:hypothetical protein
MTETRQSADPPAPRPEAGPPRSHLRTLLAVTLGLTVIGWPLGELLRSFPWPMLGGGIGTGLSVVWRAWRDRERWPEQRAVARALRDHSDPGPEYRPAADQAARVQLGRPGGALVAGVVLVGVITAACVRTALDREDPTVALSAIPMILAFVWGVLLQRRVDERADRWLADPPYPPPEGERG